MSKMIMFFAIPLVVAFSSRTGQTQEPTFNQEQALAELKKQIAGKEDKPAEEVFKNVQLFKGRPASQLLRTMEQGYTRALGVTCTHCHVPGEWEKEDKTQKQVTRDMVAFSRTINTELLKKIKNLKSENASVNCTTCHRGQVKPALNLTPAPAK